MTERLWIKARDIIFLQISIIVFSLASVAAKKASDYPWLSYHFVAYYLLELFIIGVYAILWQQVIKRFDISVAYANKGTAIIWTLFWAVLMFHENVTCYNMLGVVLVIMGIILVFRDA